MMQTSAFLTSHATIRRLFRVGETVVLEVTATYPQMRFAENENQTPTKEITRFNEAYRAVAEAFVGWCEQTLAKEARGDFSAAGVGAAYTFDRRIATCLMEFLPDGEGEFSVRRLASLGSRRGGVWASYEQTDRWRTSDLTLISPRGR